MNKSIEAASVNHVQDNKNYWTLQYYKLLNK